MQHEHHMQGVMDFGFWQMWDPLQILITLTMIFFYIKWLKRDGEQPVKAYQKILYFSGVFIYLIAAGGPINFFGHHFLLSAHMLQQALLYYIVPPLLILGIPKYVFQGWVKYKWGRRLLETHLIIYLLAFDILFSLYHLPVVFDVVMANYVIMVSTHLFLFILAIQMWWPIISPLPEIGQITELKKMGFIILGAVLLTPSCGLIIFASKPLYAPYMGAPQIFDILPALDDQQLAGVLMKLVQEISQGSAIAYLFFRWYRKENKVDSIDVQPSVMVHHGKEIRE